MATIRLKRSTGSSAPTSGLTFGEPAFTDGINSLYVWKNNNTAVRVGAEVDATTTLGTSDDKIPTQKAVKTYVDNNLAGGAVTSINGATGAVTVSGSAGIDVQTTAKTITVSNIGVQSLNISGTANGGLAVTGAGTTGALTKSITLDFSNLTGVSAAVGDLVPIGDASDLDRPKDVTIGGILDIINGDVNVDSNGTSSIAAGAIVDADIASNAGITVTKLAAFTISGHTLGNNLSTLTIGNGLNGTSYNGSAAVTISNAGVTGAAAGTGISVSSATGNVTISNTGVTGAVAGTGISVSSGTGNVTITNTGVQSLTLTATTNGGLAVSGAGTTGALSKAVTLDFSNLTGVSAAIGDLVAIGDVSDSNLPKDATVGSVLDLISGDVNVDSNGTSSIAAGAIVDADIASNAAITVTKLAAFTISGHTLGNNLSTLTIGTGLGGTSYNGSGAVTITNTGVTQVSSGTGISVTSGTGNVTITNTGVQSLAGTANEIEVVTAATGAVQIGLPDNVTIGGNLSVVGNLTINGTTTTVNSTTVAIQDPIFTLGGTAALGSDDNKDRGIEFRWHNGTTAKTGFFGFDDSISRFTFIPDATNSSEVFSGTVGDIQIASAYLANGANLGQVVPTTLTGNRTYTLPDHTGTVVVPANLGTSNYILKANGTTSQPTWIDATAAGFTAYNATNVTSVEASGTYYLAMASAVGTNQLALDTAATALTYVTSTGTLTCTQVEATVDGGSYV